VSGGDSGGEGQRLIRWAVVASPRFALTPPVVSGKVEQRTGDVNEIDAGGRADGVGSGWLTSGVGDCCGAGAECDEGECEQLECAGGECAADCAPSDDE
jgi:hypothetical protein